MQFLTGIIANGTIVVVNGIDWIKQRKIDPLDLLLLCLATSRFLLQLALFFIHLINCSLVTYSILIGNIVIFIIINDLGLWLATWLSVFYCAKIATIPHPFFVWLKMKISKLVPWLIVGTLIYSLITASIHNKYTLNTFRKYIESFFSKNETYYEIEILSQISLIFLVIELGIPLLIFLLAVLLLVFSLGKHTQQMRTMATGTRDLNRSPHLKALQYILSFLILFLSHYLMAFLFCFQNMQSESSLFLFCLLVVGMYPAAHSVILILANPRLKQSAQMFFLHGKCRW